MDESERIVAVISPWQKLSDLVKRKFRVESLPAEKKVMVWRDDLLSEDAIQQELRSVGIAEVEFRKAKITSRWQDVR